MLLYLRLTALVALIFAPFASLAQTALLRFRLLPSESQILTLTTDPFGQTVTGELTLRDGEAGGRIEDLKGSGQVRVAIDAASYNSSLGLRDDDVQTYYLHVKDYPTITFVSGGIDEIREPSSSKEAWNLTIKGTLDLHGVKKEIRVPVRLTHQGRRITVEGSTRIFLKDFNISVPTLLFWFRAGDQVEVKFRFVGEQVP